MAIALRNAFELQKVNCFFKRILDGAFSFNFFFFNKLKFVFQLQVPKGDFVGVTEIFKENNLVCVLEGIRSICLLVCCSHSKTVVFSLKHFFFWKSGFKARFFQKQKKT